MHATTILALAAAAAASPAAFAQLTITKHTFESGGPSTGGTLALRAVIGQPDAALLTAGGYTLSGGFFAPLTQNACYANCDESTVAPILNVDDFTCFINQFAQGQALPHAQQITAYANCDGSTVAPALNVDDFTCFINEFAAGCP